MIKRLFVSLCIIASISTTDAQNIEGVNARLDGMGGSGLPDDIGWTIGNPRAIVSFPDIVQASAIVSEIDGSGSVFGRMVLIKAIGDHFLFGLTANNNRIIWGNFYTEAENILESGAYREKIVDIPHLNLCYRFNDNYALGIGVFSEMYRRNKTLKDTTMLDSITVVTIDSSRTEKMVNYGGTIDAKITAGPVTIAPIFTLGKPTVTTAIESKGTNRYTHEYTFKDNLFYRFGTMVWGEIGRVWWITGGWFRQENYQLTFDHAIDYGEHRDRFIDWFAGFTPAFHDNLFLGPEYDGGVAILTTEHTHSTVPDSAFVKNDSTFYYWYHTFRLGMEKSLRDVWFFNILTVRAGMVYKIDKEIRYYRSTDGTVYREREIYEIWENYYNELKENDGMKLTLGLGVTKGRATFDVSAELLEWKGAGFFSGPTASMATLTVDISNRKLP